MLFDVTCRTGRLQVDDTAVRVVSFGTVIWSTPRESLTYIGVTRGAVMADITVYTIDHTILRGLCPNRRPSYSSPSFPAYPMALSLFRSQQPLPPHQYPEEEGNDPCVDQQDQAARKSHRCGRILSLAFSLLWYVDVSALVSGVMGNASQTSSNQQTTPTTHAQMLASSITQTAPAPPPITAPTRLPTAVPTATPTPRPTPKPTQPPAPKPTPTPSCQAVNGNPWCYNFTPGSLIYDPPSTFCSYFNCIPSFWEPDDPGDGYVIQYQDSTYSQSGGERGACSYHGGELRPLYAQ